MIQATMFWQRPAHGRALVALLAVLALVSLASPALAGKLEDLRQAGTVGERYDGFVQIRAKAGDDVKAAVDEINAKRREIYEKRAAEEKVPADQVGRVYAKKIYEEAASGTWFLAESGDWSQKP